VIEAYWIENIKFIGAALIVIGMHEAGHYVVAAWYKKFSHWQIGLNGIFCMTKDESLRQKLFITLGGVVAGILWGIAVGYQMVYLAIYMSFWDLLTIIGIGSAFHHYGNIKVKDVPEVK
jgi:uncharacterized membrane protein YccF (DUF307 family)